ncbi:MAG: alpha/beta hydrolase [Acidimicrobiia bacterium]
MTDPTLSPEDVAALVDPETAAVLATVPGLGTLDDELLGKVRRQRIKLIEIEERLLSGTVTRTDIEVEPVDGDAPVSIRVHRPQDLPLDEAVPCIYWMHGGGYVLGTNRNDDLRFDRWCRRFRCAGVSVEYRLAPETPYPGPLHDAYAGLRHVHAHAGELGIDPARIGVGGASAGAGLAAGLALHARDRGEVPLAFQALIYPMLDDRMTNPSTRWEVPVWNPGSNVYGWRAYLGDRFGTDDVPAYAAPARAERLAGLPPTYILVGTLDGFFDEDVAYAQRLNHEGVPAELHVYPGAPHGFDLFAPDTALAKRAVADLDRWLGDILGAGR